jgi:hypothetical protein
MADGAVCAKQAAAEAASRTVIFIKDHDTANAARTSFICAGNRG